MASAPPWDGLLAARGDPVVLAARREEELTQVAEEIAAAGGQASACVVDVTCREDLVSLVKHATARFGRLDALVATPASRRQARWPEETRRPGTR